MSWGKVEKCRQLTNEPFLIAFYFSSRMLMEIFFLFYWQIPVGVIRVTKPA